MISSSMLRKDPREADIRGKQEYCRDLGDHRQPLDTFGRLLIAEKFVSRLYSDYGRPRACMLLQLVRQRLRNISQIYNRSQTIVRRLVGRDPSDFIYRRKYLTPVQVLHLPNC
jgi:hypothetical protein